jgi:hypothetical protein
LFTPSDIESKKWANTLKIKRPTCNTKATINNIGANITHKNNEKIAITI